MKVNLKSILFLGLSILTSSLYPAAAVYLENNYGAKINYKISAMQPEGAYIGTNVRVLLGEANYIPELHIRTTGTGSSYVSSYYSISYLLTDIKNQQTRHSNEDAIIIIGPSPSYSPSWNLSVRWEAKGKVKTFEPSDFPVIVGTPKHQSTGQPISQPAVTIDTEELERELDLLEATTADARLSRIKGGVLGAEYARKASEICSSNYTQAKALGKIDLCERLKKELIAPHLRLPSQKSKAFKEQLALAKKRGQRVEYILPDLAPAIEDIKKSIDRNHNALAGYKSRGEAS